MTGHGHLILARSGPSQLWPAMVSNGRPWPATAGDGRPWLAMAGQRYEYFRYQGEDER